MAKSPPESREIEPPDTVSTALQQFIRRGKARVSEPWPTTNDGWRELVRSDEEQLRLVERLLDTMAVRLSKLTVGGVACHRLEPQSFAANSSDPLILHLHEGGYLLGAGLHGVNEAILLAHHLQLPVLSVDYRMPPRFPFPAALDDALAVWRALTSSRNSAGLAVAGTSSGGALALALVQQSRDAGLPLPSALSIGSPWSDLSKTGDSYRVNAIGSERYEGLLEHMAHMYAGILDLKDPQVSPVYGSFLDFPPTILTSGTRDLFLSNTVRVDYALRRAGVQTRLQVLEGQVHAAYLNPELPESCWVFSEIASFLSSHFGC